MSVPALTRRDLFRLGAAGVATTCAAPWFQTLAARAAETKPVASKKAVILVWLIGGPPQSLTFDLKDHSGIKPAATAATGVQISEHFAKLGKVMKDATVLRGMRTSDSNHGTARYLMHTGYRKGQNGVTHPVLGSIVSHELGNPASDLPNFISVGSAQFNGFGAGLLGPKYAPIRVEGDGLGDLKPAGTLADFDARAALVGDLNATFLQERAAESVQAHQITLERASRLMHTTKTKAFDLSAEPAKAREPYGTGKLADQFLLARRLVETGVKFVEIRQGGWDVHQNTVARTTQLTQALDTPLAALIADLKQRGMLNDTLVITMGEFGRNPQNGSNHFSRAWSLLLAGGGLKHGRAIGDTGKSGGTVEKDPVGPGDFVATVCKTVGIDFTQDWTTSSGRPISMVAKGSKPVAELF